MRCAHGGTNRRSCRTCRRRRGSSPPFHARSAASCSRAPRAHAGCSSRRSAPISCRSTARSSATTASRSRATSSCSPRRRPRGRTGGLARRSLRSRSAPRPPEPRARRALESPPRRRPTTWTGSSPPWRTRVHHLPERLRARRRLRRNMSRRHEAHSAGRPDHRPDPRHPAAPGAAGRDRPRQHDSLRARWGSPRGRRPGCRERPPGTGARGRGGPLLRRARQRAADPGGRDGRRHPRRARAHEPGLRAHAGVGDLPRPRCLLAGGREHRARPAARRARAANRSGVADAARAARSRGDGLVDRGDKPLRGLIREHAAQPPPRASRARADRPGATGAARGRRPRTGRRRRQDLCGRRARGAAPLRGLVRERRPRCEPRERSRATRGGSGRHRDDRGAGVTFGQRFARLVTDIVVRRPSLWRVFRPLTRWQFDRAAPKWDRMRSPGAFGPYEAALDALETPPRRALDLGTGTGRGAFAIARRFPEAEVVGADIAEEMLSEARRLTPPELADRVRFETADGAKLPYDDGSFDLVGLGNMIPFFDELARAVAPGGAVVVSFSAGAGTPIYVPAERLRSELGRRRFADFADFSAGNGTALLAYKRG